MTAGHPSLLARTKKRQYQKTEGFRRAKLNWVDPLQGHEKLRYESGRNPAERAAELALDGVDAEVLFPNVGLAMWATKDAAFSQLMCRAWNEWAWEAYGPYNNQLAPMACVAPADTEAAIAEIQRCAALGLSGYLPTV